MKRWWVVAIDTLVILIAYGKIFEKGFTGIEVLLALTVLFNVGYLGYKLFNSSSELNPQPEPPRPTSKKK